MSAVQFKKGDRVTIGDDDKVWVIKRFDFEKYVVLENEQRNESKVTLLTEIHKAKED